MPFCPQCGVENPASARFCDQCGAVLIAVGQAAPAPAAAPTAATAPTMLANGVAVAGPSTCPQCGAGVIPGEAFCDNCGASLLSSAPTVGAGAAPPAPGLPYGGVPPQPSYPPPAVVGAAPTLAGPAQPSAPPPVQPAQPVAPVAPVLPVAPARSALAPAQLIVHSSGARLSLPAATQAVIGRSDPVSGFFPEVDLMPHGALEHGVGRRHVRLFIQDGQVKAEDLDSTNGTFINTVRVAPRTPQALRDGDELRLGNLLLKVVL